MNDPYLGQDTDTMLGQEFLTWLWFRSETSPMSFCDAEGHAFTLTLEQRLAVQGGEGENLETATVSGSLSELREARLGLRTGKKVTRALVRLEQDGMAWQCTLKAEDFSFAAFKTPKIERDDDDDPDALFLEKIYLMERALGHLDAAYKLFLRTRLDAAAWQKESREISDWILQKAVA